MAQLSLKIPMTKVMDSVSMTVRVTGMRPWKARVAAGIWLMRLAARVMGLRVSVELEHQK